MTFRQMMRPSELWATSLDSMVEELQQNPTMTRFFDLQLKSGEGSETVQSAAEAELEILRQRLAPFGLSATVTLDQVISYGRNRADVWFSVTMATGMMHDIPAEFRAVMLVILKNMAEGSPAACARPLFEMIRKYDLEEWSELRGMVMHPGAEQELRAEVDELLEKIEAFVRTELPKVLAEAQRYFAEQAGTTDLPPPQDVERTVMNFLRRLGIQRPLDGESPSV